MQRQVDRDVGQCAVPGVASGQGEQSLATGVGIVGRDSTARDCRRLARCVTDDADITTTSRGSPISIAYLLVRQPEERERLAVVVNADVLLAARPTLKVMS